MLKYLLAWLPMLAIAIANAALRESQFATRMSELRAHQASTATGILFFGAYIWAVLRLWKPETAGQALAIGMIWLGMTVVFEFLFGHFVMGHSWSRLLADYNLFAGRVWILIPIWLVLAPLIFHRIQN